MTILTECATTLAERNLPAVKNLYWARKSCRSNGKGRRRTETCCCPIWVQGGMCGHGRGKGFVELFYIFRRLIDGLLACCSIYPADQSIDGT